MATMKHRLNYPNAQLSKHMISMLPDWWFADPDIVFFDPAFGGGNLLAAVRDRLISHGHTKDNILSRLVGYETNKLYVSVAEGHNGLRGARLRIKTYEDVLNVCEQDWRSMSEFDGKKVVVVQNPPYNDNQEEKKRTGKITGRRRSTPKLLHLEFSKKFIDYDFVIGQVVIMPIAKWCHPQSRSKFYREDFRKHGLFRMEWKPETVFEGRRIRGGLGIFTYDKMHTTDLIDVWRDGEYLKSQRVAGELSFDDAALEKYKKYMQGRETLGKFYRQKTSSLNRTQLAELVSETPTNDHVYKCYETINVLKYTNLATQQTDHTVGTWRTAFNHNGSPNQIKTIVVDPKAMLSYSVDCLVASNEKQARQWEEYLHSKRIWLLLSMIKTSATNAKKYFDLIPVPTDIEALTKVDELING